MGSEAGLLLGSRAPLVLQRADIIPRKKAGYTKQKEKTTPPQKKTTTHKRVFGGFGGWLQSHGCLRERSFAEFRVRETTGPSSWLSDWLAQKS